MKKICLFLIMIIVSISSAEMTYGPTYFKNHIQYMGGNTDANPIYLFMDEVQDSIGSGYVYLTPGTEPDPNAEGYLYYDDAANTIKLYNGSAWVSFNTEVGNSLDLAYDAGYAITVDGTAVTLTVPDNANNAALIVNANDATNNTNGIEVVVAASNTGSGLYVNGTTGTIDLLGDNFSMANTGVLTTVGVDLGTSGIVLANDETIVNDTDNEIQFGNGTEDISFGFATGNTLTLSSDTAVDAIAMGAVDDITGLGTIAFDSAASTVTLTSDGAAQDLTIALAGATDSSLKLTSTGTGADAISLITSAGGMDLTVAGAAAGEDLDILSNSSVNVTSSEAGVDDAVVISTSGAASGMQITSLADIDITTTGAAGEDISLVNTGGSVIITATEAAADAVVISASTAGGGIDIISNADVDISTTGAAGEDVTITNTGGSINLTASEADAAAISIQATAGGVDIDAIGASDGDLTMNSGDDMTITAVGNFVATSPSVTIGSTTTTAATVIQSGTGDVTITSTDDIIVSNNTGTGDVISLTNTQGTAAGAIAITATAGSITATTGGNFTFAVTGNVLGNIYGDGSDFLMGYLRPIEVEPATSETVLITDSGKAFVTTAGQGTVTYTLPPAVAGLTFTFVDHSAGEGDDLIIDCAADDTIDGDSAGDAIESVTDAVPQTITLLAVNGIDWVTVSKVGTWGAQ